MVEPDGETERWTSSKNVLWASDSFMLMFRSLLEKRPEHHLLTRFQISWRKMLEEKEECDM